MNHPTRPRSGDKPAKPRPDFPLFPHATRRWAKKIKGRLVYFGPWEDPDGALAKYLEQKDDLYAGRKPRAAGDGLTVRDLCNRFLTSKKHQLDTRELSPRTFGGYLDACKLITAAFGKTRLVTDLRPEDFEGLKMRFPKTWGPTRRGNTVQVIRSVFRYAADEDLVDKVIKFGKQFKRPSRKAYRIHRAAAGKRMFEAVELRAILEAAGRQLKAMVLLGVNAGFGNNDVSTLTLAALNLDGGWVNHPRPKTGVSRRCPLWPETVAALRDVLEHRREPKDAANAALVFVTKYGLPWVKAATEEQPDGTVKVKADDAVSKEMAKVLKALKLARPGANFYACRHVFETIGGEARDQVAVNHIMGHADSSMAGVYRERIGDERLKAVANHIRGWLFPPTSQAAKSDEPE